jgi:hypothetical protein
MKSNANDPSFAFDQFPLHWQMTRCEKYAFNKILEHANPEIALEIGTYKGGSLQVIAKVAQKVFSLDINSKSQDALKPLFENVEFLSGDSKTLLPTLLARLETERAPLGFVLIDGDHSTEGVRADINAVLRFKPNRPSFVVFHDSFNPECRSRILAADWDGCPYVHYVEIDFIPGVFHFDAFDTAPARSMYGGLALALMLPEKRDFDLKIHESQRGLFETVFKNSCHLKSNENLIGKAKKILRRTARILRVNK